jgi:hypothetical protein
LLLDHNKTKPNQIKPNKNQTFSTNKLQERKPWVQASCDFGNNKREERVLLLLGKNQHMEQQFVEG